MDLQIVGHLRMQVGFCMQRTHQLLEGLAVMVDGVEPFGEGRFNGVRGDHRYVVWKKSCWCLLGGA